MLVFAENAKMAGIKRGLSPTRATSVLCSSRASCLYRS